MGLIFDGVDLELTYGVVVSGAGSWAKPERDRELVHVPGRNGDLIYDNGCWLNVEIPYSLYFRDGWLYKYSEFCEWLCSHVGYFRLEDPDRHPGVYRMAEFAGQLDPKKWLLTDDGIVTITFNCKPQQWLLDGEELIELPLNPFVNGYFNDNKWNYSSEYGLATPLINAEGIRSMRLVVTNNRSESAEVVLGAGSYDSAEGSPHNISHFDYDIPSGELRDFGVYGIMSAFERLSVYSPTGFDGLDISINVVFENNSSTTYDLSSASVGKNVENATKCTALPIVVIGNHASKFRINDFELTIAGYTGSENIIIDCDMEDCYIENTYENSNRYISIKNDNEKILKDFPYLAPGNNILGPYQMDDTAVLSLAESTTSIVKIKPNWYKI